jgi:hypothetical protein
MATKTNNIGDALPAIAGTTAEIEVNILNEAGKPVEGCFPAKTYNDGTQVHTLVRGFRSENTTIGTVAASSSNKLAVVYSHLKDAKNRIFFYSVDGRVAIVNVINTPIHTHQSIAEGGPAFGTYFRDKKS